MRRPGLLGPKDFKKLTDEELYDVKVEGQPGSNYWKLAEAEQQRRQSIKDKKSAWYESKGFWVAFAALIVTVLSFGVPYLISYLNREEARLNQKINEETARAYVQVTSFSLDPSAMFGKPDFNRKFVQGFVTILNSGKVAANGIRIMLDANPPHADRYFVVVEKDNL